MAKYQLLNQIDSPDDVKRLPEASLSALADEIRAFLVEHVSKTGGHLASNLGVVELSIALARVFNTPHDHIIWDVGHQSYVHKLLTGRRERFGSLRQSGGLCGFTKRSESEHDCFGAGHSSTSISAALGFAEADRLSGSDAYSIAVMGDGAFTGGMIHEALNNCRRDLRLIIIINENEMSISKNIGRFAENLSRIRSRESYFESKKTTVRILSAIPLIGKGILSCLKRIKRLLKNMLYGSNYFEKMGLYYLGPVDGNDMGAVEELLRVAKEQSDNVIIHLKTKKGKGYPPAEADPDRYHGLSPENDHTKCGFSAAFGDELCRMASEDERICGITAAMCSGTGLSPFKAAYPDRFFDVGIAEGHAVTFAAGLAANGKRPFAAIYSTFLQRAYDSIIHDVALQNLPVCLCLDRAGLNAADGPTHHGIFDVSFLSGIPNMTIYTPVGYAGLRLSMRAAARLNTPSAIRYGRGEENPAIMAHFYGNGEPTDIGIRADFAETDRPDAVLVVHGRIAAEAIAAKHALAERGISLGLILAEYLKPYDRLAEQIAPLLPAGVPLLTLEEELRAGGMGMNLTDALSRTGHLDRKICIMALDDSFGEQTVNEDIYKTARLDREAIFEKVRSLCRMPAGKGSK